MDRKRYLPFVWFVLGFGVFMFTRMSKIVPTIPIAILIAPVFILRFNRIQPAARGNLLTLLGFILSINIGLWGLFAMDDGFFSFVFSVVRSSLLAVLYFLPYMLDRLIYPRFKDKGIASALIFPLITTAVFFLSSLEGPFDGAIQSGKFVYGPLIAQQLLSLFGIWSFIFISSWFASILNYLWENNFDWHKNRKTVLAFIALIIAVFSFGAIKISSTSSRPDTVKIAAIILTPEEGETVSMEKVWADRLVSPFEKRISRIENLTETAALKGARIVSFQELAIIINEEDQERLREEYKRIAKETGVYLSITYGYFAREGKGENKHLLIDGDGEIKLDYTKRYLVGLGDLGEAGVYRKGPEIIQSADTPYGKVGISICRDMEFVKYIRQAGKADVDIMLSPSYEWPKSSIVSPVYMRAIENGFSFVRPTYNGVTFAQDFTGKILAQMDSENTDEGIMYAEVPAVGVKTIYAKIGDLLGWICVFGLLGLISLNIVLFIRQKKEKA